MNSRHQVGNSGEKCQNNLGKNEREEVASSTCLLRFQKKTYKIVTWV